MRPGHFLLLLSPSLRQSQELFKKVQDACRGLDNPAPLLAESALRLELANGSRIISLPGTEGTVRGYSGVDLLIIDEAARVVDDLYYAVTPMLAVSQGAAHCLEYASGPPWLVLRLLADRRERLEPDQDYGLRVPPHSRQLFGAGAGLGAVALLRERVRV